MLRALFFRSATLVLLLIPFSGEAQVLHQDLQEQVSAEVVEIVGEYERNITGTEAVAFVQEVRAVVTSGEREGDIVEFESEIVPLAPGDKIFLNRMKTIGGEEYFSYADFERRPVLIYLAIAFVAVLLIFSGWQGVRALISLGLSVLGIFFLLVPALLAGVNPALASVSIAGVILALILFGTHGINPRSIIAFFGTISAVIFTSLIAWMATSMMKLSGFSSDASVYLNFATGGSLDLSGLLLGSIIIGILGILDDVAITQASVVEELKGANSNLKFSDLYQRAIKVGRDHIGSLVNTLALAYVGVSLPLILLYAKANSAIWLTLNQEVVVVELVRIIVGSLGLVLAVPATTAVAAWYFNDRVVLRSSGSASHGHSHH